MRHVSVIAPVVGRFAEHSLRQRFSGAQHGPSSLFVRLLRSDPRVRISPSAYALSGSYAKNTVWRDAVSFFLYVHVEFPVLECIANPVNI